MTVLERPTAREQRLAQALRAQSVDRIEALGIQAAADRLRLRPSGVNTLLARRSWTLETALRVAEALEADVPGILASTEPGQ